MNQKISHREKIRGKRLHVLSLSEYFPILGHFELKVIFRMDILHFPRFRASLLCNLRTLEIRGKRNELCGGVCQWWWPTSGGGYSTPSYEVTLSQSLSAKQFNTQIERSSKTLLYFYTFNMLPASASLHNILATRLGINKNTLGLTFDKHVRRYFNQHDITPERPSDAEIYLHSTKSYMLMNQQAQMTHNFICTARFPSCKNSRRCHPSAIKYKRPRRFSARDKRNSVSVRQQKHLVLL